jgi:D-amino-acid dehydrogenase
VRTNQGEVASERGYHVVWRDAPVHLPLPVMPSDGKMALTPTLGGLRVAGQVDLAAVSALPDWWRAELLARFARQVFPALRQDSQGAQATASAGAQGPSAPATRWLGHRPSTPDGLLVIGPSPAYPNIVHAFGHGHVGLAATPATAELVADLMAGRAPTLDARPYRASRF